MEDALRSNTAQIEYAQRFNVAREALVEITTIVEYYREIMEEEGDKGEIAAIDEEIVHFERLQRFADRQIAQGL